MSTKVIRNEDFKQTSFRTMMGSAGLSLVLDKSWRRDWGKDDKLLKVGDNCTTPRCLRAVTTIKNTSEA
ncbi:hypothetical protein CEXT_770771 [Caerostris extrusa]|uniref:Uncharacterized protein n=1 Tax=Caerostris extrusa TaxID=172846 RepID=A0AAV4QDV9_CAEEX|nr:hypothetical protein CEXT_770771 [Caerostris extrusa]